VEVLSTRPLLIAYWLFLLVSSRSQAPGCVDLMQKWQILDCGGRAKRRHRFG
jgi:hypothetical protein